MFLFRKEVTSQETWWSKLWKSRQSKFLKTSIIDTVICGRWITQSSWQKNQFWSEVNERHVCNIHFIEIRDLDLIQRAWVVNDFFRICHRWRVRSFPSSACKWRFRWSYWVGASHENLRSHLINMHLLDGAFHIVTLDFLLTDHYYSLWKLHNIDALQMSYDERAEYLRYFYSNRRDFSQREIASVMIWNTEASQYFILCGCWSSSKSRLMGFMSFRLDEYRYMVDRVIFSRQSEIRCGPVTLQRPWRDSLKLSHTS